MKKINYLMLAIVFILQLAACSGQDRVVTVNDLPQTAQKLISTHFVGKQVSLVKKDVELTHVSYDVVLKTELSWNSTAKESGRK